MKTNQNQIGNKIDHSFSNSSNGWCATCDPNAVESEPGYCGPGMATVRIWTYCL